MRPSILVLGLAVVLSPPAAVRARPDPPQEPSRVGPPRPGQESVKPPAEVLLPPPDEPGRGGERVEDYLYNTGQAIQFFQARVRNNPRDFASYRLLGELYERRGTSEGGGLDDFARAENALRASLKLFPEYVRAQASLASVLCQRHKFAEALELAARVREKSPRNLEALAITADALIELGRYEPGEIALEDLARRVRSAPVLARMANLAELKGRLDNAERLMCEAAEQVRKAGGTARERAWYQGRLGDLALAASRLDDAETLYKAVPAETDPYHDATAGLGKIRAMQGRINEAITYYEKAVAIGPDPRMLAALGDLYQKAGRRAEAEASFARLLKLTEGRPEYLRDRARFFADHDRDPAESLRLAEADFQQRQDVYGSDTLAWALFHAGRAPEAARAINDALRLGTRDPVLHYHAGLIYQRLGDSGPARDHLTRALAISPRFSVLHADEARAMLKRIEEKAPPQRNDDP